MHRTTSERTRFFAVVVATGLLGCVAGPALDQIHVIGGALSYATPVLLDQAWWVAPQFGLAFALIVGVATFWELRAPSGAMPTPVRRVALQLGWFIAAYVTTGALWEWPWLVAMVLLAALAVRVALERPDRRTVAVAILLAAGGTAYEATLSSVHGTFGYAETGGPPVPAWLPLLYLHAAPLVRSAMLAGAAFVTRRRMPLP